MNLRVYEYATDKLLGIFLSISADDKYGYLVWYATEDGVVLSKNRESILVKEIPEHGF